MTGEKAGTSAVIDAAGGPGEAPTGDAEQLPLLPDMRSKGVYGGEEAGSSGAPPAVKAGRPAGARNKRTKEMVSYIGKRYGSPLERLAQFWSSSPDDLAKQLKIPRMDAIKLIKDSAVAGLPYMEQKQPVSLDVKNEKTLTLVVGEIGGGDRAIEDAAEDGVSVVLQRNAKTGVYEPENDDESKG